MNRGMIDMAESIQFRLRGLVTKLVVVCASFASIMGLLLEIGPPLKQLPWWGIALMAVGTVLLLVFVVTEFLQRNRYRVYRKSNSKAIRRYMHRWIGLGGRVAIWTRDLTWAAAADTRALLTKKAEDNELILCMATENELSRELGAAGAEVCYSGDLLESPASRFTIANFERDGSAVAVGRTVGDKHVIEEFRAGDHPAYHIAVDLVRVIRKPRGLGEES